MLSNRSPRAQGLIWYSDWYSVTDMFKNRFLFTLCDEFPIFIDINLFTDDVSVLGFPDAVWNEETESYT